MANEVMVDPAQAGPPLFQIASRVLNRPLLLHPQKAEVIMHVLEGRIPISGSLQPLGPEASRFVGSQNRADGSRKINPMQGNTAVISIVGSLVNRGAWIGTNSGLTSYEGIAAQVREAASDPQAKNILLDIDSPGGEATGMFALAQLISEVAKTKTVIAMVNDMAASAAYGIASAASEIVVSPTSMVGSIGVVLTHLDRSGELAQKGVKATLIYAGAHKVDGNPFGSLSESVKADLQIEVAKFYDQFVSLVAQGRGAKLTEAMARATEARVFLGQEAVDRGLADRVASLDAVLSDLSTKRAGPASNNRKGVAMTGNANDSTFTHAQVDTARAEGSTAGATAERTRIGAILNHAEAVGREAQAKTLALDTDLSAEQAGKVLASSPKALVAETVAAPLTIEQRAAGLPEAGAGAEPVLGKAAATDAAWAAAIKKVNRA